MSFSVTYDGNGSTGGAVPEDATAYDPNASVTVLGNSGVLTLAGHSFVGWSTLANNNGIDYAPAATFLITENTTLYAVWGHTVTYDGNTNDSGAVPTDAILYPEGDTVTVLGNTGVLVKTGCRFNGWNTAANGTGAARAAASTFMMTTADVTLYAQWVTVYAVTYDGNTSTGGSVPTDTLGPYAESETVTVLTKATLTKTGYRFVKWNTVANGSGTDRAEGATFAIGAAAVTLYAQWIAVFALTYDDNGSTSGSVPVDATLYAETETVTVSGNSGILLKTGYAWLGWNTLAIGGAGTRVGATFVMPAEAEILYAEWEIIDYTVTFDANHAGTTGSTATQTITYDTSENLTINGYALVGHTFTGWNTQADGLGTSFADEASYLMAAGNVTLYAKWTTNEYTVTFDKNNGSATGTTAAQTVEYGVAENLTVNGYLLTGYRFLGWSLTTDGAVAYVDQASFTSGVGSITLYAIWTLDDYTVTFDKNNAGATGTTAVQTCTNAVPENLTANGYALVGYEFLGWATTSGGSVAYVDEASYTIGTANVTLYAKWGVLSYNVVYNGNGSTGGTPPATVQHAYNSSVTVLTNSGTLVKTGRVFIGWNTAANETGTDYLVAATFTQPAAAVTLYAVWGYTVTFDADGGTTTGAKYAATGDKISAPTAPTKSGYAFAGWFTDEELTNEWVFASNTVTANTTLYAYWGNITLMRTIETTCSNGVTYGHNYTITAEDAAPTINTAYLFDFDGPFGLAAVAMVKTSTGVPVAIAKVTYPAVGQVQVEIATELVVAGSVITVVAQNAMHDL